MTSLREKILINEPNENAHCFIACETIPIKLGAQEWGVCRAFAESRLDS